jgi:hypothetical protein
MNRRYLAVLLVIFAVLVVAILLQPRPVTQEDLQAARQATLSSYSWMGSMVGATVGEVAAIRLRDPATNRTFVMRRDASGAWLSSAPDGALDAQTLANVESTVVLLPFEGIQALERGDSLQNYGFSPEGLLSIEFVLGNGQTHAVAVGNLLPSRTSFYGVLNDLPQLFLLERGPVDFLYVLLRDYGGFQAE